MDSYSQMNSIRRLRLSKRRPHPPSRIHYTFWKSIASDSKMAQYCSVMMRLPFIHGFKIDQWAKSIDVMPPKEVGIKNIYLLQIIGLVEADFNTALKLYFAKHLILNSEKTELTEEQWGGHPGQNPTDTALYKMLSFEYGRALYVTMALFGNGAAACFDRMVPNISTLVAHKYDMEPNVMITRNIVMADMEHSM